MKHKSFIIKIIALFMGFGTHAQYSEVGAFGGGTNFIGDVGDYGFHLPKDYAFGAFYRFSFNRHWAIRAQFNYGYIRNADSLSDMVDRQNRNLSFQSTIMEGSLMMEFNFLEFEPGTRFTHTPYVMGGIGAFRFNPTTQYQGQTYELRELGTEGQRTSENPDGFYSLGSSFFIFGMGYKWAVSDFVSFGVETTFRSTGTDYLDDASGLYADPDVIEEIHGSTAAALSDRSLTESDKNDMYRGNPQTTDWYRFTGVTVPIMFAELYEKCASFVGQ